MSAQNLHTRIWLIGFGVFAVVVWALKPMLLPFVAGLVLAYFLDPVVEKLARWRVPRALGTLLVLLGFVLFVVLLLLLLLPLLQNQIGALIKALPGYVTTVKDKIMPWAEAWMAHLSSEDVANLREAAGQYAGSAMGWAGQLLKNIISEGFALFDILALIVITPVVAFYLLRDWRKLTVTIDSLLPRKHHDMIRDALREIDRTLSGFLRGQALVCLCLGIIYSVGLSLVGIKYGATIGIIAGVLSFIPYVGSTFCGVTSLALAFVQYGDWQHIALVLLVFLVGQSLESYVLTPKLVGGRVGLHPVWILFALFAGGALLGFVGVLIAVPVAAVAGVLIRLAIRHYKNSSMYKGSR